jgi:hypothetical protein
MKEVGKTVLESEFSFTEKTQLREQEEVKEQMGNWE